MMIGLKDLWDKLGGKNKTRREREERKRGRGEYVHRKRWRKDEDGGMEGEEDGGPCATSIVPQTGRGSCFVLLRGTA